MERSAVDILRDRIARTQAADLERKGRKPVPNYGTAVSPNVTESIARDSLKRLGIEYQPSRLGMVKRVDAHMNSGDVEITETGDMVPIRKLVTCDRLGNDVKDKERSAVRKDREAVLEDDGPKIRSADAPDPILTINGKEIKTRGIMRDHRPVWPMMVETLGWAHASIVYTVCRKWLTRNGVRCPEVGQSLLSDISTRMFGWRIKRGIAEGEHMGAFRVNTRMRVSEWARTQARQTKFAKPYSTVFVDDDGWNRVSKSQASLGYTRKGSTVRFDWSAVKDATDHLVLSDQERSILMLHLRGLSPTQIASSLLVSPDTVWSAMKRMRTKYSDHPKIRTLMGGLDAKDADSVEWSANDPAVVDGDDN